MPKPASVDAYLASLPPERAAAMAELRRTIRAAAPEADEVISYNMPAFKTHGQFLVSYDAFKAHYSLFPASQGVIDGLGEEIAPYLFGSGTIRFAADRPLPLDLVTRVIAIRLAENEAEAERRRFEGLISGAQAPSGDAACAAPQASAATDDRRRGPPRPQSRTRGRTPTAATLMATTKPGSSPPTELSPALAAAATKAPVTPVPRAVPSESARDSAADARALFGRRRPAQHDERGRRVRQAHAEARRWPPSGWTARA